jgi:UDP-glucose 4-epimerase
MTGGGGFLGAHLLARFVGAGMSVTLVGPDTGESRYTAWMVAAGEVRFVRCDPDFSAIDPSCALDEADALVLLGDGEPLSPLPLGRAEIGRAVVPFAHLVAAFARPGKHIVLASSDAVYGAPERNPVRELDPLRPRTALGLINAACEEAVRACSDVHATATILRYSTIYGPGETATRAIPSIIRAALAGRPPVVEDDGLDEHDYIHVVDAADAMVSALRRRVTGTYNVGTGIGTTMAELASLIVWLTGSSEGPVRRPGECHATRGSIVLDASRAHLDLAVEARHELAEGLKEEIGWFKATYGRSFQSAA